MALITAAARSQLIALHIAMFNAAPSESRLSQMVKGMEAGSTLFQIAAEAAKDSFFAQVYPGLQTGAEFANKLADILTTTDTIAGARTWAVNWATAQLTAGVSRSDIITAAVQALRINTNPDFANAKTKLDNMTSVGEYYAVTKLLNSTSLATLQQVIANVTNVASTVTTANASINGTASAGQTFTLTIGADSSTGTAGNDTFTGAVGSLTTLSATDKLVGGTGTDTLNITVDSGTDTTNGADISGIEVINVRNVGTGTAALNASQSPGTTAVNADRGTGALDVTNLATGATFGAIGNGVVTLGALGVGYAAAATAATINVSGGTVSTGTITQTGAGLLSTTINSTGAANKVGGVVMAVSQTGALTINATTALTTGAITQTTAAAATSVVVTGAGAVDISAGALMPTVALVDASANTGGLKVVTGNTAAGTSTAAGLTVKGTSAGDTINIVASDAADFVTVNASAGADVVKVLSATQFAITNNYTVTGNSAATLQVNFADTADTQNANLSAKYVGFGTLEVVSDNTAPRTETLAMDINKLAISNFVYSGDAGDTLVITGTAAASTVTVKTNATAITATIGTNTSADVLNVVLDGTTMTGALTATGNGTTGYETLNITTQKDTAGNTNAVTGVTAGSANVNISGAAALTTGTITTKAAGTVDASAMTAGTLTATLTSATTTFKGGAGVDALTLGAGTLAQGFSYDGGAGDNTIAVTATAAQNVGILALTNFKTVTVTTATTGADTTTFDLRNVSSVSNLVFKSGTTSDNIVLNNVKTGQVVTLGGTVAFDTVSLSAPSGTTQALAFNDSLTVATLNIDAAATSLTLSEITGKTATITNAIAGGSMTSLTLTGAGSFAIGAQVATTKTIDGSALSAGTLTATLGAAGTLKGGAGGDALTGSSGADTINGGAGADTITTGGGLDTLTGGDTTALDTFVISGARAGTATSQITITDFATAAANTAKTAVIADTLHITKATAAAVNAAATSLTSAASLADALNLLAAGGGTATSQLVAYGTFGGDTYIVVDYTAGATLAATDTVIKLTGVTNFAFADAIIV